MKQAWPLFVAVVLASTPARAQEVTLPLDRYEELRARARPSPLAVAVPPAPFALEAAQLELSAGRSSARVSQSLTLSIYTDDWVRVPLAPAGSLTSVQLGTLDGRVETTDGVALVARGRGRHQIQVGSVVPMSEDTGATRATRSLSIALPAAATVTGALLAGAEVQEVVFGSGGLANGSSAPHRFEFVGQPGATLAVQLLGAGRAIERTRLPLKYEATSFALAQLLRTRTRIEASVAVVVSSGELETITLELPGGFDVVSVLPDAGWTQEGRRLTITPAAPVQKAATLDLVLTGEPQTAFGAPLVVPAGAARLTLLSAVHVVADGIPELVEAGSSRRAEAPEIAAAPEAVRRVQAPLFVVRDPQRPPRWSITWSETSAVLPAQIDRLQVNVLVGLANQAAYQLWAEVRSSGSTELVLALPPGLELSSVERDGVPVRPGVGAQGLVVPLGSGTGAQLVHVAGLLTGLVVPEQGEIAIPLPSSTVPIGMVEMALRLPGGRRYALTNPERAGEVSSLPSPRVPTQKPARQTGPAPDLDLRALVAAAAAVPRSEASYFSAPANAVLLQARWSALASSLGPLTIRVEPAREKEEWF